MSQSSIVRRYPHKMCMDVLRLYAIAESMSLRHSFAWMLLAIANFVPEWNVLRFQLVLDCFAHISSPKPCFLLFATLFTRSMDLIDFGNYIVLSSPRTVNRSLFQSLRDSIQKDDTF